VAYPKSVKDNLTDKETAILRQLVKAIFMDNNLFDNLVLQSKKLELSNVKKLKQMSYRTRIA
jgi:ABC-type siderophore export system fused ATPase/permease subunit